MCLLLGWGIHHFCGKGLSGTLLGGVVYSHAAADTTIHYDAKTIEALLDRDQEGAETADSADVPGSENLLANEYLSSFKVASYVTKEVVDEEEVSGPQHTRPSVAAWCQWAVAWCPSVAA